MKYLRYSLCLFAIVAVLLVGSPPPVNQQAASPSASLDLGIRSAEAATSVSPRRGSPLGQRYRDPLPTYLCLIGMVVVWSGGLYRLTRRLADEE